MKTARVIIVVMGASYDLMWEIQEVKKRAYLMKTIFILPSFLGKKMAQQSWKEFIDYSCVSNECREKCNAVNANNVLGIGFLSPREPIIFCANKTNKLYYETLCEFAVAIAIGEDGEVLKIV